MYFSGKVKFCIHLKYYINTSRNGRPNDAIYDTSNFKNVKKIMKNEKNEKMRKICSEHF